MIRPYQSTDDDEIVDVWFTASSLAHPFLSADFMAQEKMNVRNIYLPNTNTWVYVKNGKIVGFISMIGNEVGAIFLEPTFHGQGIGKAMMDWVAKRYETLEVEVFKDNKIGRAFYDRYGFQFLKEYFHEATKAIVLRLKYS